MKTELAHLQELKSKVEASFGRPLRTPADFNELSTLISETNHERLGVSTLKRIWGYVKSDFAPTYSTLSVLSRYAGYRDWHHFCIQLSGAYDSNFSDEGIVVSANLCEGVRIAVEWPIDKSCVLRKIGNPSLFAVMEAENIKLKPGDTCSIEYIAVGEKFIAVNCQRNGHSLGTYIGARREGVSEISIL